MDGEGHEIATARAWVCAVLCGGPPTWLFAVDFDERVLLDVAEREGVVALLHERLRGSALPGTLLGQFAGAARIKAAQSLFREHQCRLMLGRLQVDGLRPLLLKGSALAYWAYAEPYLRECSDIDLLFASRAEVDRAVARLAELGYRLRAPALPGDLVCFELTCVHDAADGLEIDLHWHVSSTPVFAFRLGWDELDAGALALPALMAGARGLAPVPAYVHACMHRAQSVALGQGDKLKWLYDLVVLGRGFGADDWNALQRLAVARGLAGACLDAMRVCAECFGPCVPEAVSDALQVAARSEALDVSRLNRWGYMQRMSFLAFPTWRQRLRWLRQRLVPYRAYLRWRYGEDRGFARALFERVRAGMRRWRG